MHIADVKDAELRRLEGAGEEEDDGSIIAMMMRNKHDLPNGEGAQTKMVCGAWSPQWGGGTWYVEHDLPNGEGAQTKMVCGAWSPQ